MLVVKSKYKAPETKLFHRGMRWLSGKNTHRVIIRHESGDTAAYKRASAPEYLWNVIMTLKKLVEGTFWFMCYAELSSIMPVFSNRDLQVFRPLCTVFNDIAHSHSPIQQPSLWLSNHRLHLFFFSSLLSLSISLCLFVNLYSSVSLPPPLPPLFVLLWATRIQ